MYTNRIVLKQILYFVSRAFNLSVSLFVCVCIFFFFEYGPYCLLSFIQFIHFEQRFRKKHLNELQLTFIDSLRMPNIQFVQLSEYIWNHSANIQTMATC